MGEASLEQRFLSKASRLLDIGKWGSFLIKWAQALDSYDTPREFVDSTTYKTANVSFGGRDYPFIYTLAPNYSERAALMARQVRYENRSDLASYGLNLDFDSCFLCQNVVQAIDADHAPDDVKSNAIFDLGGHYIIPNRYPAQLGHSLSVPKNHDDMAQRVLRKNDESGKMMYLPEQGKTRGNILTEDYLAAVIESCDKYNLLALRNHVLDGMSIPGHDHFHLMPEDLPSLSLLENILGRAGCGEPDIIAPPNTPFDSIVIISKDGAKIPSIAVSILTNMEQNNEVFTLIYKRGCLLISPRYREQVDDRFQKIGGGVPIHYLDTEGEKFIQEIERLVPMKGRFGWDRYI